MTARPDDGTPTVLFLCVHNAGRSQMALGWFNHLAGDKAIAWSGGSEPGQRGEPGGRPGHGRGRHRHRWRVPEALDRGGPQGGRRGDHHGLRRRVSAVPRQALRGLGARGPGGKAVDAVRPIRDDIEVRVRRLLASLGVPLSSCRA